MLLESERRPDFPAETARERLSIVIPAKNEEFTIGAVLDRLPLDTLRKLGYEPTVLVLDGRSQDGTAQVAAQRGAKVIVDAEPGKGSAFRHARPEYLGTNVIMLDADGTYAADAVARVAAALRSGASVVMARRVLRPGSMSAVHRAGNRALSILATLLYGRTCRDLCTGLWGFRAEALAGFPLASRRFGLEAELFACSVRLGHRITVVDVDYLPRQGYGQLRLARDGVRILSRLVRCRFRRLYPPVPPAPAAAPSEAA